MRYDSYIRHVGLSLVLSLIELLHCPCVSQSRFRCVTFSFDHYIAWLQVKAFKPGLSHHTSTDKRIKDTYCSYSHLALKLSERERERIDRGHIQLRYIASGHVELAKIIKEEPCLWVATWTMHHPSSCGFSAHSPHLAWHPTFCVLLYLFECISNSNSSLLSIIAVPCVLLYAFNISSSLTIHGID